MDERGDNEVKPKKEDAEDVREKTWDEFRETGLLLIVNQLLHVFGWAIVVSIDAAGYVKDAYPARVRFRGFDEKSTTAAYRKVSGYMVDHAAELKTEADE